MTGANIAVPRRTVASNPTAGLLTGMPLYNIGYNENDGTLQYMQASGTAVVVGGPGGGIVTSGAQTFAGAKTWSALAAFSSGLGSTTGSFSSTVSVTAATGAAVLNIAGNLNATNPYSSSTFSGTLGMNLSAGNSELSLINNAYSPTQSFQFYQATGASARTLLLSLSPAGAGTFASTVTSTYFASTGSGAGFSAGDRSASGTSIFYRSAGVGRLYDSTYGDVLTYNSTGDVTVGHNLTVGGSFTTAALAFSGSSGNITTLVGTSTEIALTLVGVASASNYAYVSNNTSGSGPVFGVVGSDANIDLILETKAAGQIIFEGGIRSSDGLLQTVTSTWVRGFVNTNINLSNPGTANLQGGNSFVSGDRVLIGGQSTASQNGIYIFNGASSAMTRASDFSSSTPFAPGVLCYVFDPGINYGCATFQLAPNPNFVLGTSSQTWNGVFYGGSAPSIESTTVLNSLLIANAPQLPCAPIANPVYGTPPGGDSPTYASLEVRGIAGAPDNREFLANFGMVSYRGKSSGNYGTNDKVTLYCGMLASSGTADVWAFNPCIVLTPSSGTYNAQCIEADFVNFNANRVYSSGDLAAGISLVGGGTYTSSHAIYINGNNPSTKQWDVGLAIMSSYAIGTYAIYDGSAAPTSIYVTGSHTTILDAGSATSSNAAIFPNNSTIFFWNAAHTVARAAITYSSANLLSIGETSAPYVVLNNTLVPVSDNTYYLGSGSLRWNAVYAVTGTIQTSDGTQKANIKESPLGLNFISRLKPVSYNWADETDEVLEDQTLDVHEHAATERAEHTPKLVDGKWVTDENVFTDYHAQYETVPLHDAAGNVMRDWVPIGSQYDPGNPEKPVLTYGWMDRTHKVARRTTVKVPGVTRKKRPGTRTYYGFIAQDVERAVEELGVDYGGLHKGDVMGLNYTEKLAAVVSGMQQILELLDDTIAAVDLDGGARIRAVAAIKTKRDAFLSAPSRS